MHRLKHQGPARVLRHLSWLAARYPSPLIREKLAYLQKREAHMQYPTYQEAGWPIGSGSVESANKLVVEARLKGAGMRWGRQNVNPMLVLRNAVCNREWKQTWATSVAHRQTLRAQRRQATSQQRLERAVWFLVVWGVRVHRLSHSSGAAAPTTAEVFQKQSTARPGSGYSWRKPFLRRPPSTTAAELCAKNETHPAMTFSRGPIPICLLKESTLLQAQSTRQEFPPSSSCSNRSELERALRRLCRCKL